MLHIETVEPGTFSLLKGLMALDFLQAFSLVGGTALSLRFGHRSSVDLDLFFHEKFDSIQLQESLIQEFGNNYISEKGHTQIGIFCYIQNVKVDFVYYSHPLIGEIENIEGLRLYSNADISAMKIQAILGRGKKKDFWDLYELLQHYSLQQMMDWHEQKFPSQILAISIPNAISYFVDAEETEDPISFKNQSWETVKSGLQKAVREYLE